MGKSKPAPQTTTVDSSVKIPEWLDTAAQGAIGRAQDLSNREYTPNPNQLVADVPKDTTQAYQQVRDLQGRADPYYKQSLGAYSGLIGQAQPQTAGEINNLSNQLYGNYASGVLAPTAGLLSPYLQNQGPATAAEVGNNAASLMSPYAGLVLDPALRAGQQQLALANQQIAGQAANVGAFGGSRQGVQQGVAEAQTSLGTQKYIGDVLNQGWNTALPQAASLAALRSNQGYNADALLAGMMGTGYGNAQTEGAHIGDANLQAGLTAAQQMPQVASAWSGQGQKDASLLQTIGAAQQNQRQQELNAASGQFYEKQDWPVQNLDLLLSAIGGVPYGVNNMQTSTGSSPQKNVAGSVLGGAASGASMGAVAGPWGALAGGVVGGILGGLS